MHGQTAGRREGRRRSLIVAPAWPLYLNIETTSHCNLRCVMCPQPTMARARETMDRALFDRVIEQAAGRVEFAWLHLFGEPLMNPEFAAFAKHAHERGRGLQLGCSSNVTLLRGRAAEELARVPLAILMLAVDGIDADSYSRIRVNGDFDRVLENLDAFAELYAAAPVDERPARVVLSFIDLPTLRDAAAAEAFWRERLPLFAVQRKPLNLWAMQDLVQIDRLLGRIEASAARAPRRRPCGEFSRGLTVLVDGRVVPCCNDHEGAIVLGDLRRQTLEEIWNSAQLQELRADRVLDNPLCRYCQHQDGRGSELPT